MFHEREKKKKTKQSNNFFEVDMHRLTVTYVCLVRV